MSIDAEIQQMRRLRMLRHLDAPKLKLIAVVAERVEFADREPIFSHGDPPDAVFIVLAGAVGIYVKTPEETGGRLVQVAHSEGAIMLGETGLLCEHARTITVLADGPVSALRIPAEEFRLLLRDMQPFAEAVTIELARQLDVINGYLAQRAITAADAGLITGRSEEVEP